MKIKVMAECVHGWAQFRNLPGKGEHQATSYNNAGLKLGP